MKRTAFVCGFALMALELLGGRLLQPVFGASIDVWAAVICVFILALSLGYWLGGELADRGAGGRLLGALMLLAAVWCSLLPAVAWPALERLGPTIHAARWGSLVGALLLFLPPSMALGCVTPILVKLACTDPARIGRTTGTLYAVNAAGNVFGVLVADYWLLAAYPLSTNLLLIGALLGATGLAHLVRPSRPGVAMACCAVLGASVGFGAAWAQPGYRIAGPGLPADERVLAHRDTPYTHASWVVSASQNYAQLRFVDKNQGGVCLQPAWRDGPGSLVQTGYITLYAAGVLWSDRLMAAPDARLDVFMVGLGSGAGISVFAHHWPEASVTVAELDPAVIEMVREHYPFIRWLETQRTRDGRPRARLLAGDARRVLTDLTARAPGAYDVVILDAFGLGSTIPPHLATRECFELMRRALRPDGILLCNIHGSRDGPKRRLLGGILRTFRAAGFASVAVLPRAGPHEDPGQLDPAVLRPHLVAASSVPIDPVSHAAGWARAERFVLYPELPEGRFVSESMSDRIYQKTDWVEHARRALPRGLAAGRAWHQAGPWPDASTPPFTDDQPNADLIGR